MALFAVTIDAPDASALARFYSDLLGMEVTYEGPEGALIAGDGKSVMFQQVDEYTPPRWPDPAYPQQAHLDLRVPDLDAASARAVELGAELLRRNENWYTLADPAGHPFDLCRNADDPRTTLMGVMLDCPDPTVLSTFYAELLGKPVTYAGDGMAMIGEDGAQPVLFQQVAEYSPPRWPDPAHPQQFHLDVRVGDVEAAEPAALAIGATRLPGEGENWRVYADPAGKPFCFVWDV
jgi:catechol 2,3-dioxygenase-like lactoylglutathione lyase family enzyme